MVVGEGAESRLDRTSGLIRLPVVTASLQHPWTKCGTAVVGSVLKRGLCGNTGNDYLKLQSLFGFQLQQSYKLQL